MRTTIVLCAATLLASVGVSSPNRYFLEQETAKAAPRDLGYPNVYLPLNKLVPQHWQIVQIDTASYPYGVGNPEAGSGLAITLRGPMTVRGSKGQPAREEVTIWVMPDDYKTVDVIPDMAVVPSLRFGLSAPGTRAFGTPAKQSPREGAKGKGYLIYFTNQTQVESWVTWEKDIQDFFGIERLDYRGMRPPSAGHPLLSPR